MSEIVTLVGGRRAERGGWWGAYDQQLQAGGLSTESRQVIAADCEFIVSHGVLGAGPAGSPDWGLSRERSGLVMGAVQSGKTASMMGVAAKSLDAGVDAVVILAGTRTALWLQTLERVQKQLDTLPDRRTRRLLVPAATVVNREGSSSDLRQLYAVTTQLAERTLSKGRPIVAVVMKHVAHLSAFAETVQHTLLPLVEERGAPFHLLVMDDEADDSSVVDAASEVGMSPLSAERKQVPRHILDLWESRQSPGATHSRLLHATYLAYTATPQANFLQDDANPLAPRDFVASLRTAGESGEVAVRSSSYRVAAGSSAWYTGGQVFYETLDRVPLCLATDGTDADESLRDSVRAYLVACAVRLMRLPPERLGPASAVGSSFNTEGAAVDGLAPPMSMLVHPSSSKDEHFDVAERLLDWSSGEEVAAWRDLAEGERRLHTAGLEAEMDGSPALWTKWLATYHQAASTCTGPLSLSQPSSVPLPEDWAEVRAKVLEEVIPGTRVAVINSDENADDRPQFAPFRKEDGRWAPPRNLSTIFVSGNVMSRGLTLEGLTTTFFSRSSDTPLADTQMQMQRWFGYRGKYIELCRVFTSQAQIALFKQFHENDEALRRDVLATMESTGDLPSVDVLQGHQFAATGKISNIRGVQLWPGLRPFTRYMNPPEEDGLNRELIAGLFAGGCIKVPSATGRRGLLLDRPRTLLQAADLLDRLRYPGHGADPKGREASRWLSAANHAALPDTDERSRLYRAPVVGPGGVDLALASPYAVAAYLRLWSACLERRVPGMMSTDDPPSPWRLLDLAVRAEQQPRFWVGLRLGSGEPLTSGPLSELGVPARVMSRKVADDGQLAASWGARNDSGDPERGITGDERFHLDAFEGVPHAPDADRPSETDGLILFHLIGRVGGEPTIALGCVVPRGGPDHVSARRDL